MGDPKSGESKDFVLRLTKRQRLLLRMVMSDAISNVDDLNEYFVPFGIEGSDIAGRVQVDGVLHPEVAEDELEELHRLFRNVG